MSGQQLGFPESLDDILNVVKETPRGRWFIEAYTSRVQTSGTATILSAIGKLETNLQSMTGNGADAALLQRARQRIALARTEIIDSESGQTSLSAEGRLFAKLAELSRKAFTESSADQPAIAKNVERALRLVADLDQDLGTNLVPMPVAAAKPAMQYFKQDEDVFEPAPAAPAISPVRAAKVVESTPRGAKLVIQHIDLSRTDTPLTTINEAQSIPVEEKPAFQTIQPLPTSEIRPEPSRIVIIRRKAEDVMEVPLIGELGAEVVSAA